LYVSLGGRDLHSLLTMIMAVLLIVALALISPAVASCGRGLAFVDPFQSDAEGHVVVPSFSYNTSTGPLTWHSLNETTNFLCGNGTNVSPRRAMNFFFANIYFGSK